MVIVYAYTINKPVVEEWENGNFDLDKLSLYERIDDICIDVRQECLGWLEDGFDILYIGEFRDDTQTLLRIIQYELSVDFRKIKEEIKQNKELKPCPFCGNKNLDVYALYVAYGVAGEIRCNLDEIQKLKNVDGYRISCLCGANMEKYDSISELVESWNRRAVNKA